MLKIIINPKHQATEGYIHNFLRRHHWLNIFSVIMEKIDFTLDFWWTEIHHMIGPVIGHIGKQVGVIPLLPSFSLLHRQLRMCLDPPSF
jgi:hypothetical protein